MSSEDSNSRSAEMLLAWPLAQNPVARVEMGVPVTGDANPRAQARPLPFDIHLLEGIFCDHVLYHLLRHIIWGFQRIYLSIHLSIKLKIHK